MQRDDFHGACSEYRRTNCAKMSCSTVFHAATQGPSITAELMQITELWLYIIQPTLRVFPLAAGTAPGWLMRTLTFHSTWLRLPIHNSEANIRLCNRMFSQIYAIDIVFRFRIHESRGPGGGCPRHEEEFGFKNKRPSYNGIATSAIPCNHVDVPTHDYSVLT